MGRAGGRPLQELAGAAKRATWENISCHVGDLISANQFKCDLCDTNRCHTIYLTFDMTYVL